MNNAADNKATRAGRYERQPPGYRAFIPAPLPREPQRLDAYPPVTPRAG